MTQKYGLDEENKRYTRIILRVLKAVEDYKTNPKFDRNSRDCCPASMIEFRKTIHECVDIIESKISKIVRKDDISNYPLFEAFYNALNELSDEHYKNTDSLATVLYNVALKQKIDTLNQRLNNNKEPTKKIIKESSKKLQKTLENSEIYPENNYRYIKLWSDSRNEREQLKAFQALRDRTQE